MFSIGSNFKMLITNLLKHTTHEAYHDECYECVAQTEHEEIAVVVVLVEVVASVGSAGAATVHYAHYDVGDESTHQSYAQGKQCIKSNRSHNRCGFKNQSIDCWVACRSISRFWFDIPNCCANPRARFHTDTSRDTLPIRDLPRREK